MGNRPTPGNTGSKSGARTNWYHGERDQHFSSRAESHYNANRPQLKEQPAQVTTCLVAVHARTPWLPAHPPRRKYRQRQLRPRRQLRARRRASSPRRTSCCACARCRRSSTGSRGRRRRRRRQAAPLTTLLILSERLLARQIYSRKSGPNRTAPARWPCARSERRSSCARRCSTILRSRTSSAHVSLSHCAALR